MYNRMIIEAAKVDGMVGGLKTREPAFSMCGSAPR